MVISVQESNYHSMNGSDSETQIQLRNILRQHAPDLTYHTSSLTDLTHSDNSFKENGFLIFLYYLLILRSQGTTDGISSAPFHTGFLSGQLWLQYGLLRNDETIICVNSVATLLYSSYLLYYFIMASYATKSRCIRLIFLEVIFLMSAHYYIHYSGSPMEVIRSRLGMCCVIFNVLTVAAPLEALREVFRTRCTETMPLPLCCLTVLVTAEWLLYGILIDDIYIKDYGSLKKALEGAGMSASQTDEVVLICGMTCMPKVIEKVKEVQIRIDG
ncbi:Sugar transporter SWEET [Dirofilaria immitis]|nr:Sugar transporter SWEET [Dirofilaria immitis]